ncbi:PREDICTED: ribosomal L1 domain-containing protein 1-like isoform X2 [Lupinus angustifolius]|uniref:ribosomal L1 domain-containing protein 1-like isoform X2 n=1 Tax=Lupinus angustifolius TaxID=3871 RepID=UPI00092ED3A3|nr:PREDICTED: ribosomal L1 domain-containing protein 1-like isoform X2 [Lupinus angustifolius]
MAIVITADTVQRAVDSLLKWRTSQSQTQTPKLFDQDDEFVYLILTLKKVPPKGRVNPHKVPLPHSLTSEFSERCLIIDDRPKSNLTKADSQKKIKSENIPISKVLKLSKLASDYRAFEAKRKLCNSYDMFFADKRIVPLLPRLLGKQFFKKKKVPVPLDLKKNNWKEQVEKALSSGLLTLRTGTCSVVRVAKLSMERDEIVENVIAAIGGVVEIIPKKWGNVRSFHVKLLESLALPVYQAVPDIKLRIDGSKAEEEEAELKKKEESEKEEESEGGEVSDRKAGKKKGRIHQVRYMDDDKVDEDAVEDKSGGLDGNKDAVDSDIDEKGSAELVSKKRKKGVKVGNGAVSELSSVKKLKKSAKESSKQKKKEVKENSAKQSKTEDEESAGKKKKKAIKQNKSEDEESADKKKKVIKQNETVEEESAGKKKKVIKQNKSEDEESAGKKRKVIKQSKSEDDVSGKKKKVIKQTKSEDDASGKKKNKGVDGKAKVKRGKKSA